MTSSSCVSDTSAVAVSDRGASYVEAPRPAGPGGRGARWGRAALGALVPLLLVGLWQALVSAEVFTRIQLPPPLTVLRAGADLLERGILGQYVAISVQRVLLGFLIGSALGLALGALVGLSRVTDSLLGPTIGALRAVPSLAWVPLLGLWVGIGEDAKVVLVAIGAFFPVYTTVASALRHVDRHLVEAGRAYGLRGVRLLTGVQLPAVVPAVISGLRLALAQAWLFLVAAELLGASMGLGFLLSDSSNNGRTDRIFFAIVALAVLGKLSDALVGVFERWALRRWA